MLIVFKVFVNRNDKFNFLEFFKVNQIWVETF